MPSVTISEHWHKWCASIVASGVRKSIAEIVEDGLKLLQRRLEQEKEEWLDFQSGKEKVLEETDSLE